MSRRSLATVRDYNRGLIPPVRWLHMLVAVLTGLWRRTGGPIARWAWHPRRRVWAAPSVITVVLLPVLFAFDPWIARMIDEHVTIRGDLRRELEAWQQFGALGSLLFTSLLVWRLDPARTRRLLDLAAAVAVVGALVTLMKVLLGRARPDVAASIGSGNTFVLPWQAHLPVGMGGGAGGAAPEPLHAWELGAKFWSMPSSHTAYAVALAVFLIALYPRIRAVCIGLAILVGSCRVLFGAHYVSDVLVGGCIGLALAVPMVRGYAGVRALDWFWARFINRDAGPALPGLLGLEPARQIHGGAPRRNESTVPNASIPDSAPPEPARAADPDPS